MIGLSINTFTKGENMHEMRLILEYHLIIGFRMNDPFNTVWLKEDNTFCIAVGNSGQFI